MDEYYKKIKKNRIDICNVCGQKAKLTWEHVPPKSCGNYGNVKVNRIFKLDKIQEKLDSQNGVKYRTLCENCNNNILGANADIAFAELYNATKDFIENAKNLTETKTIKINLVQVLKCLFGKFLAMGETFQEDKISNAMREFILKDKLDKNLHVYFRIYPYKTMIHARSYVSKQVSGIKYNTDGLISILYFYPLAFVISSDNEDIKLNDLTKYIDFQNPEIDIQLSLLSVYNPITRTLLPYNWLLNADDGYIILSGENFNDIIARKV